MTSSAIGIDLGTTYSCVGVWTNGQVEIIANDQGNRTTPSYVAFTETERLIGDAAKNQASRNPENTVFDAKRLIGRKYNDPSVQADKKLWPFEIVTSSGDKPKIEVMYKNEKKQFEHRQKIHMPEAVRQPYFFACQKYTESAFWQKRIKNMEIEFCAKSPGENSLHFLQDLLV